SLKTSIKTITYLSDTGCLEIQGASLRAYGVSLPWNNSLLIIGGETAGGKAVTDSVLISVKDNKVTVQN
ncbi:N-acetylneuraminic acid mutarotase, partial [Escherichia coli]